MLSKCFKAITVRTSRLVRYQHVSPKRKTVDNLAGYFNYSRALVASSATLDSSFVQSSIRLVEPKEPIDLEKARGQHTHYVSQLQSLIGEVVTVKPDTSFPDQVFVEDPVVVLDGIAVLTHMKARTRAGEVGPMEQVLKNFDIEVVKLRDYHPEAYMDGGDVLFTGRELLVGISQRTNMVSLQIIRL